MKLWHRNQFIISTFSDKENATQWRQIYTILAVCLPSITLGQLTAWPSPSVPILISDDNPNKATLDQASYFTLTQSVAGILAAPIAGTLIDLIGRKYSILSVIIFYCIAWVLVCIGGPLYIYYLSRVFNGLGDVCFFSTIPGYMTEVVTPEMRGTWGNAVGLAIFFGQFLMNVIGAYLSIRNAAYVSFVLLVIFILNFPFLPESPYYFLLKKRTDEARKTLQWLRGKENVEDELRQLELDVQRQLSETGRYIDIMLIESNRRAATVGILLRFMQQFSGITAFAVYAQVLFMKSGSDLSASTSAIVFTGFLFASSTMASIFLDRIGRRLATLISCGGCCIVLFSQAAFFYVSEKTVYAHEGFLKMAPLISMLIFVLVYSIGLAIVPTLMLGELFSSSIKSKAYGVMNVFYGFSIASSAQIFALLLKHGGLWTCYLFFAICTFCSIVVSYIYVPETKGKTLEEIQQDFKNPTRK